MMSATDQQILAGMLRDPRNRLVFETWLGEKVQSTLATMREAIRQGKWKDAAMAEGSLRAYEDLLSELSRL